MSVTQYKIGTCNVANGSQIVIGASTDWLNEITSAHIFKVDKDGEATYSIGNIVSATRMVLAANYTGSTDTGLDYMICRDYTPNRSYWRPGQGDHDFAELLSQEVIDQIDTDVQYLYDNLSATVGDVINFNASLIHSKAYIVNSQVKIANYQMGSRDHYILASGNVTITLASASDQFKWQVVNVSLATTASILIVPSGANTISGESSYNLASKYDLVGGYGDGRSTIILESLKRGVEISW